MESGLSFFSPFITDSLSDITMMTSATDNLSDISMMILVKNVTEISADNLTKIFFGASSEIPYQNISNVSEDSEDSCDYCYQRENMRQIFNKINFAFSIFGIINSILTLFTLIRNKNFSEPCFLCYHSIALFEFLLSVRCVTWYIFISRPNLWSNYYWCYWYDILSYYLIMSLLNYCIFIIITFLSLLRFAACAWPYLFQFIRTRRACIFVISGSFFISLPLCVPGIILSHEAWKNNSLVYDYYMQDDKKTVIYFNLTNVWRILEAVVIFVSSTLAIVGMIKASLIR